MRQRKAFGLGAAMVLVAGIAATSAALWLGLDQQSLEVSDLLRVEPSIDATLSPVHAALAWSSEITSGQLVLTEPDFMNRLAETFRREDTPAGLRAEINRMHEALGGPVTFVRLIDVEADRGSSVGFGGNGVPVVTEISVDADGQIDHWLLTDSLGGTRLPPWQTGMILVAGFSFMGAALLARASRRRHAERMLAVGAVVVFAQTTVLSDSAGFYALGRIVPLLAIPITLWVFLDAYPVPVRAWPLGAAWSAAVVGSVAVFLADPTRVGHPSIPLLADSPELYRIAVAAASGLTALAMGIVLVQVVNRRSAWHARREPAPWIVVAGTALWSFTSLAGVIDLTAGTASLSRAVVPSATLVGLVLAPASAALASMYGMWNRAELADLVVDLEKGHENMQDALAKALDDDSLQLLRWSDGAGGLVDDTGKPVSNHVGDNRRRTHIVSSGRVVGALDHDAILLRHPERVRAVAAAAGMALQVERLNARVAAQLAEVSASRGRIVVAADEARKKVERDLHDGAQQRLVALGLMLQRGRRLADGRVCEEVAILLEQASAEVREALMELREVSRGMHPALLAERGLSAAIEGLTDRLPIAVRAEVLDGRLAAPAELASYYVVAESLTNVVKHSGADEAEVTVDLRTDGAIRIVVADQGCGGAESSWGSGLQGLADRLDAIGGTLQIDSPADEGTRVEAVIPCG